MYSVNKIIYMYYKKMKLFYLFYYSYLMHSLPLFLFFFMVHLYIFFLQQAFNLLLLNLVLYNFINFEKLIERPYTFIFINNLSMNLQYITLIIFFFYYKFIYAIDLNKKKTKETKETISNVYLLFRFNSFCFVYIQYIFQTIFFLYILFIR